MKTIVLFIAALISLSAYSQDIPKNANTILVKGISFNEVVTTLLDSNFTIEKMDKEFQTIKTDYRKLCSNCVAEVQFNIRIKDSLATINGKWRSDGNWLFASTSARNDESKVVFDIIYTKFAGNYKESFKTMNKFALSFNKPVEYVIR